MSKRVLYFLCACLLVACDQSGESSSSSDLNAPQVSMGFVDVTDQAGINFTHYTGASGEKYFPEMAGGGGGFFDYNGDGWEDILLINGKDWAGNQQVATRPALFENLKDGTFKNVTSDAGLDVSIYGMGFAAADYDNDGDQDLVITAVGPDLFFVNDNGYFRDATETAGIKNEAWSTSPMFFDYDKDGLLDLFIANYVEWSEETDKFCSLDGQNKAYCTPEIYTGIPSKLYRNRGDGTFDDVSSSSGIGGHPGKSLGVALLDADGDGNLDVVVANDTSPDFLFKNKGDGTFEEVGLPSGIALDENGKARAGMGIDVGVVDDSGEETIFIGNFSNEMIGVYRDIGNGFYIDRAAVSQIGRSSLLYLTFGLFLFDYDLDYDLDLFVANGHVQPEVEDVQQAVTFKQRPLLYENVGGGQFEEVGKQKGDVFTIPVVGRAAGYADYDKDGDQDILLVLGGDTPKLLRNEVNGRGLRVTLEGVQNNKNAIGTLVTARSGSLSMQQRVKTGSSYLSQSELALTFGLGGNEVVDSLIVSWPGGDTQVFTNIEAGQHVHIVEGSPSLTADLY